MILVKSALFPDRPDDRAKLAARKVRLGAHAFDLFHDPVDRRVGRMWNHDNNHDTTPVSTWNYHTQREDKPEARAGESPVVYGKAQLTASLTPSRQIGENSSQPMSFEPPIIPAPVQPISYMTPAARQRPGIMTAVGVISIVIGGFSALASVGGIVSAITYSMLSRMKIPPTYTVATPAVTPMPATVPTTTSTSTVGSVSLSGGATVRPVWPFASVNPRAFILTGVESALSFLVAVLLLFAGILMLKDSPRARPMHWLFVVLKIPLIALAAVAGWMTYTSVMNSMNAATPGGAFPASMGSAFGIISASFSALFSLLYPVALMIVLSTRTAKDHFATLKLEGRR
jgi:hypothetical protein